MKKTARDSIVSKVAQILRDERQKQNLSISLISERSGLSRAMIRYVEGEDRAFTLDTLIRITDALGVDFIDVLKRAKHSAGD